VQAAIPHLKNPSAVVLNASTIATRPSAGGAVYGATKAAVVAIAKSLSLELAPKGIRVNSVSPGMTVTPIADKLGLSAEQRARMLEGVRVKTPAGRLAEASEIAQAVLFLASDQASYLYGSDLIVDGGVQVA
jgi:NAD(P)-dependent dehydrogenase (short-subunit alcohol dehydrogenase family)